MKSLVYFMLISLIFILNVSCAQESEWLEFEDAELIKKDRMIIQSKVMNELKVVKPKEFGIKTTIVDSKIEKIENNYYLKTFYNNKFVTITLLKKVKNPENEEGNMSFRFSDSGTSCTSTACAGGGGCQPRLNGYCSACTQGSKDCVRSTSSVK
jgi:hypothetical protein